MARHVSGTTSQFLDGSGPLLAYPFTLSCRFKADDISNNPVPFTRGDASPHELDYFQVSSAGHMSGIITPGFIGVTLPPGSVVAGQWYLVICVFTATQQTIYLDTSTNTATASNALSARTKNPTNVSVGCNIFGIGSPYTATGLVGDVADVAMWNIALTASDVDALVAGRPGDVQAANLVAWWKLGEDGDLTSSAGTFGPLAVHGTCPVTDDPGYTSTTKLLYSPRKFTSNPLYLSAATDSAAPLVDKLALWFPNTDTSGHYWNARTGHDVAAASPTHQLKHGEDRSLRQDFVPDQYHLCNVAYSWFEPFTWCCWVKPYSFRDDHPGYYQLVPLFTTKIYGASYTTIFGYMTDAGGSATRRPSFTALAEYYVSYGGVECPVELPSDRWTHLAIVVLRGSETVKYYLDGRLVGISPAVLRTDLQYSFDQFWLGGINATTLNPSADNAIKDMRIYNAGLSDEEMYQVYQHSRDFHEASSDLISTSYLWTGVAAVIPPEPVTGSSNHHHIMGAV